jgi:hypothetical protein
VGRASGEEVAVLKVQRVILTVFHRIHLLLSPVSFRIRRTRAKHRKESLGWAGATPSINLGTEPCPKVGSLQPNTVFCPRPN